MRFAYGFLRVRNNIRIYATRIIKMQQMARAGRLCYNIRSRWRWYSMVKSTIMHGDSLAPRRGSVKQYGGVICAQLQYTKPTWLKRTLGLLLFSLAFLPSFSAAEDGSVLPPGNYRLEMIMATVSRLPFFGSSKSASKSDSLVYISRL